MGPVEDWSLEGGVVSSETAVLTGPGRRPMGELALASAGGFVSEPRTGLDRARAR